MVIFDYATEINCLAPAAAVPLQFSSNSVQLAAGSDGVAPIMGDGNPICFEIEVTTAFIPVGTPIAQIAVIAGTTQALSINTLTIGMVNMSAQALAGRINIGMIFTDLFLGAKFQVYVNPWSNDLQSALNTLDPQTQLGWFGVAIANPLWDIGPGTHYFSAGAIKARILQTGAQRAPRDRIYPSRMKVK